MQMRSRGQARLACNVRAHRWARSVGEERSQPLGNPVSSPSVLPSHALAWAAPCRGSQRPAAVAPWPVIPSPGHAEHPSPLSSIASPACPSHIPCQAHSCPLTALSPWLCSQSGTSPVLPDYPSFLQHWSGWEHQASAGGMQHLCPHQPLQLLDHPDRGRRGTVSLSPGWLYSQDLPPVTSSDTS